MSKNRNNKTKHAENKSVKPKQQNLAGNDAAGQVEEVAKVKPDPNDDPVFAKYGEPFITNDNGQVRLNERAVTVKCASEHLVKCDPSLKTYERYHKDLGRWWSEVDVRRLLGDQLLKLGEEWNQQELVQSNNTSQFNSLTKIQSP